jgi:hypothetical protein
MYTMRDWAIQRDHRARSVRGLSGELDNRDREPLIVELQVQCRIYGHVNRVPSMRAWSVQGDHGIGRVCDMPIRIVFAFRI